MNDSYIYGIGITGLKVSGRLHFLNNKAHKIKKRTFDEKTELLKLERAKESALSSIEKNRERTLSFVGESEAEIFEIHKLLLLDEDLGELIVDGIKSGMLAEEAISRATKKYKDILTSLDDEYLSARAMDIGDVEKQLLSALSEDEKPKEKIIGPYILVAEDLTPAETVQLERSKVLGFVTFGGTPSSHTAILARSMGIPALVGVGKIDEKNEGGFALLDAEEGKLIINPSKKEIETFEKEKNEQNKIAREHERYLRSVMNKPAVTRHGHRILIYANIEGEKEISGALSNGAEGIGLLRSEFLYLSKSTYPTEEELFEAYRDVAIKMDGKRVIIRTLDIGADKQSEYFDLPSENNPALGFRAVRICLERPEMFKTQLRAILRASYYGSVSILIPMIVSLEEIRQCKALIEEAKEELRKRGESFDSKIEIGIMIETPASAIMSDVLAKEVDFFSVGTNDLTQYTLAVDRQNPRVAKICEKNYEPVLRLIKQSTRAIHENGGWIGVCGEMAADLTLTEELAKIGVDELSVSVPYLLGVRGKVSECK